MLLLCLMTWSSFMKTKGWSRVPASTWFATGTTCAQCGRIENFSRNIEQSSKSIYPSRRVDARRAKDTHHRRRENEKEISSKRSYSDIPFEFSFGAFHNNLHPTDVLDNGNASNCPDQTLGDAPKCVEHVCFSG